MEKEALTDYRQMKMKQEMEEHQGVWWEFKMRTRCQTCKARADDKTLEETRMNHIARKSQKDVARANAWTKHKGTQQARLAAGGHRTLQEGHRRR